MEADQINKFFGEYYEALEGLGAEIAESGLAPPFGNLQFNFANRKCVNANAHFSTPPKKKEST